jgi:hypothetical protein
VARASHTILTLEGLMRTPILSCLLTVTILGGCGDDGESKVPPRILEGGGISDGPIDGVANIYVINDATREPIAGAKVLIGTLEGETDATGLFIAEDVTGPQTVAVKADTFRSEMWVGANGANMTFNLSVATTPVAPRATLTGTIDTSSIVVPQGHLRFGLVFYSQTEDLGDASNEIQTPDDKNICNGGGAVNPQPCAFTIDVRGGRVALLAAIYDRDLKGTPANFDDDTMTLIRWAYRGGISVTAGVAQSGQDLTLVDVGNMGNLTVDFGSPPSGLQTVGALIGINLGTDGVFQIPLFRLPTDATLLTPKLAAFTGATSYRLTAIATNGTDPATTQSIVIRRVLTGPTLAAGTWLTPPTSPTITRTGATWTPITGATVQSVEYKQGTASLLNVTVFDGSTEMTIPELIALPAGTLTGTFQGIAADGLDVMDFALDVDEDKLDAVAGQTVTIN